jgi:uncharacterized membrane protein
MAQADSEHSEHLQQAGETIEELRDERHESLPKRERIVQASMSRLGRPSSVVTVIALIVLWIVLNLVLRPLHRAFDTETFALLGLTAQLVSLVAVLTILSAQNSQRKIIEERDRLTLQLTLIIDKKITEALRELGTGNRERELYEPTDLHRAAEVLRKAEEQAGKDDEERAGGDER